MERKGMNRRDLLKRIGLAAAGVALGARWLMEGLDRELL